MTMEAKKVEETLVLVQQATAVLRDHLRQAAQAPLNPQERQSLRTHLQLLLPPLAIVRSYEAQHTHRCVYTTVEAAVAQVLASAALRQGETHSLVKPGTEGGPQITPAPPPATAPSASSVLAAVKQSEVSGKDTAHADQQPRWGDIYGCADAVLVLRQATTLPLRFPALFTGPRRPWRRLLLYGPPGTGKTQLAAATATEYGAVFLSVSAADLLSKWVGESEKQVRQAFAQAAAATPYCVLFFDEIDALCAARGGHGESEVARRLKTEFLLHLQTAAPSVLVLAATNVPWELDAAIARRFERFIHVGLPAHKDKLRFLRDELRGVHHAVTAAELRRVVRQTEGFSLVDVRRLLTQAVMAPITEWLATHDACNGAVDGPSAARTRKRRRFCSSTRDAAVEAPAWASPPPSSPPPSPPSPSLSPPCRWPCHERGGPDGGRPVAEVGGVLGGADGRSVELDETQSGDTSGSSSSTSSKVDPLDAEEPHSRSPSAKSIVCATDVPAVQARHFEEALRCVAATSSSVDIARYVSWASRIP